MIKEKKTVTAPEATPAPAPVKKLISFEQWAAQRGLKAHHRGGRRAFVRDADYPRTLEAWDVCFKDY